MTTIIMVALTIVSIPIILGGAIFILFWGAMMFMGLLSLFFGESTK